ncbi:unnamed protein product [Allacma fusca]|uniref:Transmembrane protein 19 n=1 Tax=Allacma fusca TaxID=39272 RepID=A0A8J2Q3W7_9HEXA|nr:unnamed protein product [Allacma fusca]
MWKSRAPATTASYSYREKKQEALPKQVLDCGKGASVKTSDNKNTILTILSTLNAQCIYNQWNSNNSSGLEQILNFKKAEMKLDRVGIGEKRGPSVLPILGAAIIFPLSVVFWVVNSVLEIITTDDDTEGRENVTLSRWLLSVAVPVSVALYGLRRKSLSGSGAGLALVVGFFLTVSSYCFSACLLVFFLSSSRATKFGQSKKRLLEHDFKEGGQRNWIQVLCNGGMATELAIMYVLDVGYGQYPIDFVGNYRASWLAMGVLGALSCGNGDTWASELGTVIGSASPRLITTFRKVPKGTNGGVSLPGLVFSGLGGVLVGLGYYLMLILTTDGSLLKASPPQWPIIIMGGVGGLLGSVIDSYLGALFQFSGVDEKGVISEVPGQNIRHISGVPWLDNHSVNLLSTVFAGILLPPISANLWSHFY